MAKLAVVTFKKKAQKFRRKSAELIEAALNDAADADEIAYFLLLDFLDRLNMKGDQRRLLEELVEDLVQARVDFQRLDAARPRFESSKV